MGCWFVYVIIVIIETATSTKKMRKLMKVELSDSEREYLADKIFWDWKHAEIAVLAISLQKNNEKAIKRIREEEKRLRNFYERLKHPQ